MEAQETNVTETVSTNTKPIVDPTVETKEKTTNPVLPVETEKETTPEVIEPENVEPKKEVEEKKSFDPENVDFDEIEKVEDKKEEDEGNEKTTVEGYDLSKFEEVLDFESDSSREYINAEMKEIKELGFTQEQAEKYINKQIDVYKERQEELDKEDSPEYIKEKLKSELTVDERRNYKPITNWIKEQLKDEIDPEWISPMMANPKLVKVLNSLYKKSTNSKTIQPIPTAEKKTLMTVEDAIETFKMKMNEKDSIPISETKQILTELQKNLTDEDLKQFNQIYSAILR